MRNITAWKARLKRTARLASGRDFEEFAAAVAEVRGNEPDDVIDALLEAVRAPEDHGAYEGLHDALWRFPEARLATALARRLPALIRRMNKHDQVLRFVSPLFGEGVGRDALPPFLAAARALPSKDRATLRRAVSGWAKEHQEIESVVGALAGKKMEREVEDAPPPPPATWPKEWRGALAKLRSGMHAVTWKTSTVKELPRIVALLTQPLGRGWREAEALTNPLYISFAKKLWPDFVDAVRALDDDDRKTLLSQLARVDRARAKRLRESVVSSGATRTARGRRSRAPKVGASTVRARAQIQTSYEPPRARRGSDEATIARLRKICLALPEANERISHGEPTWFAAKGKAFAMLDNHHHGAPHLSVWLPMPPGAQALLVEADPERFFRPPYVGPSGWVGVVLDRRPDWKNVAALVRDAFVHVATRKLIAQLTDGANARPAHASSSS